MTRFGVAEGTEVGAASARLQSAAVAGASGTVLALAAWLDPSPTGVSTHTQLGLSPCTFLAWTGWPCPMCGATTTFSLMAHGRVLDAFLNQPFAALLFVVCLSTFGIAVAEAIWPTGRWTRISDALATHEGKVAGGILVGMFLGWIWKIVAMA